MGGVPKWNKTRSSINQRRMHIFAKAPVLTKCQKCGKPTLPHTLCPNCGYYKGVEVVDVLAKLTKKERKKKEKEMTAKTTEEKEKAKERPLTLEELSRK